MSEYMQKIMTDLLNGPEGGVLALKGMNYMIALGDKSKPAWEKVAATKDFISVLEKQGCLAHNCY